MSSDWRRQAYSARAASERLGVSEFTIARMVDRGELRGFRLGDRLLRVAVEDIDNYKPIAKRNIEYDVYVIKCADFIKIGKAKDAMARLYDLQICSPFNLKLLHAFGCADGHLLERELHIRFAAYRERGEWFRLEGAVAEWVLAGCPR